MIAGATLTNNCLTSVIIAGAGIAEHYVLSVEGDIGDGPEVAAAPEDSSSTAATGARVADESFSVVSSGGWSSAKRTKSLEADNNGMKNSWSEKSPVDIISLSAS